MQSSKLFYANSQYPQLLRESTSPPAMLNICGVLRDIPLIAIVGSRRLTEYGKQVTYQLASELAAAGLGIVSGLAIGADGVAHTATLEAGGYTIAVLGSGLQDIYPPRHRGLGRQIIAGGGALITEYELGMPALKQNFPARNRIIAGLAIATIVTEADVKSGSLITANRALNCGRLVMAVPGNINSPMSAGPNNLIRSGAIPITSAVDVLDQLNIKSEAISSPTPAAANAQEELIFTLLNQGVTTSQQLIEQTQLSAAEFARAISLMEITGKVRNLGAGTWVKR